jgi:serine/threonine protein kinase
MPNYTLECIAEALCAELDATYVTPVGLGAFKETFRICDKDGLTKALKILKPGFSAERTQREIEAMTRCSHPNLAQLEKLAVFQFQGSPYTYLIEPFLDGGTLLSRIEREGLLQRADALELGSSLISALAHIAGHDLVHRDLKRENVMFRSQDAEPIIVDFGLVRDLRQTSLTHTWAIRGPGTPLYAPPEQLNNEKDLIDWRSDQFSLGVMISYCVLGFHPFSDEDSTDVAIVERVASRGPLAERFLSAIGSHRLPILSRMVNVWPVRRVRTPNQLLQLWQQQKGEV